MEMLRKVATRSPPLQQVERLNQEQLARRWNISPRTLERWRWLKQGPKYLKIGGRVLYRVEDIEDFEALGERAPANGASREG